eukprot:TRINITY_DN8654_c0_g1_i1.p1 TRINITY_DN8654_c0_g1~~TRINITY_DN8654_c0_g1_i1.p1  ORF type:complete len:512 (+),score=66.45 TRINITY_DN8654_c0_g1_i1:172-1707(+)
MACYATLPMYDFDSVKAAHSTWYACIRQHAIDLGLSEDSLSPELCDANLEPMDRILSFEPEKMLLSQTCGLPLISGYRNSLTLLGTPVYPAEGCRNTHYSSVVIASDTCNGTKPFDFQGSVAAVNSLGSLSGSLLLSAWMGASSHYVRTSTSGSHAASIARVRDADDPAALAAIDAVSFALLRKQGGPDFMKGLRVLGYTPQAPALPYVTSVRTKPATVALLKQALRKASEDTNPDVVAARQQLCLERVDVSGEVTFDTYQARITAIREQLIHCTDPSLYKQPADTSIATVHSDIAFLQELAALVIAQATSNPNRLPYQLSLHKLSEERSARLVFPGQPQLALDVLGAKEAAPRACVGFIGFRPPQHFVSIKDHLVVDACWQLDDQIVAGLTPDKVVAYCSGQQHPGGDWGNLVVLRSPTPHQGVAAFRTRNPPHARAVGDVAPGYYQSVRIHSLQVWASAEGQVHFEPCRTLQVEYLPACLADKNDGALPPPFRKYLYWKEGQQELFETA